MFGVHSGQWEWELTDRWVPVEEVVLCRARFLPLLRKEGRRPQGFLPFEVQCAKFQAKCLKGKGFCLLAMSCLFLALYVVENWPAGQRR